jgi:Flp pilus assembly protein TadB
MNATLSAPHLGPEHDGSRLSWARSLAWLMAAVVAVFATVALVVVATAVTTVAVIGVMVAGLARLMRRKRNRKVATLEGRKLNGGWVAVVES